MFTIKQLAVELQLSEMYVRRAIQQGKLQATLEKVPNTNIERWSVSAEEVTKWRKTCKNHAHRADGRKQYKVVLSEEEFNLLSKKYEFIKK